MQKHEARRALACAIVGLVFASSAGAQTVAYWRFESGEQFSSGAPIAASDGLVLEADQTGPFPAGPFTANPNVQVIPDVSGNNNTLRSFHAATSGAFTSATPFASVPGTGAANNFAWNVTSRAPAHDLYEVNTGNIRTAMNSAQRWSFEASFNQSSQVGFQTILGRDRAPGDSGGGPLASVWMGVSAGDDPNPDSPTHVGRMHFYTWNPTGGISITDMGQTGNTYFGVGDPIQINKWYSMAVTGDGTFMRLYLKGETDSSYKLIHKFVQSGLGTQTGTWTVGRGQFDGAPADGFEGKIDEVRVSQSRLYPSEFLATANWKNDADGAWSGAANWTGGLAPVGSNGAANLGAAATAHRTVTLDVPVSLDSLGFSGGGSYTINGTQTLTLAGDLRFINAKEASTGVISAPVALTGETSFDVLEGSSVRLASHVNASGRIINKFGPGDASIDSVAASTLHLFNGTFALSGAFAAGASSVEFLELEPDGVLDLRQAGLVLNHDGSYSYESIVGALGTFIVSSTASPAMTIGVAENGVLDLATFGGRDANDDALLLRTTYRGDANLSGKVDFDDLLALAQNYNATGARWTQGDYDYDGDVDFGDLLALAQNYNLSVLGELDQLGTVGGASFASDLALAFSLVPEPSTLLLAAAPLAVTRRRR